MSEYEHYSHKKGSGDHDPNFRNGYPRSFDPFSQQAGQGQSFDEIDPKKLFYTLWNYKYTIAVTTLAFTVLAGIIAYTTTPIYQSEGTMLISESQPRMGSAGSDLANMLASSYGLGVGSTIANELQVLRSQKLSLEVADSLMARQLMDNGRQFPILYSSYPDDPSIVSREIVAKRYRNSISFSQVDREADVLNIQYQSPSPVEASYMVNLTLQLYVDLSTRQNRQTASSAVSFLETERNKIEERLQQTEEELRAFMNEHRLLQVDTQTEKLIERLASLETQKQEARVKLVAVNSAIKQYKDRLDNIKPGLAEQYADAIGPNMTRLQYQLAELQIQKMQLLANNPGLKDSPNPPQELQEINEKIGLYRDRIRELTSDLIQQSDQYLGFLGSSEGNIAEAVTQLNQKLIELQVEQQQYQAQIDVIDNERAESERFFNNLPDNMIQLARLKRDVKINEELFLTVSKQYAEMALWEQTQFGQGRIIDPGYRPELPVEPNKKLYVLVGFILGGILSVGYVFVKEAFNTTVNSKEQLQNLPYPLLAVIPRLDDEEVRSKLPEGDTINVRGADVSSNLVSLVETISPATEAFRRLQNNIIYSRPDRDLKTILVTSSGSAEGKTTLISNLAVALSEMDKRVLVADLDLRKPNLHNQFGVPKSPGLFEVLFEGTNAREVIKGTVAEGVELLTAGKQPPNPAVILQSRSLLNVLKQLREEYDYLLLDTPPYGIIADSAPIITFADGVVVTARFEQTHLPQLEQTLESLDRVHANILGLVLTAFDYSKSKDAYSTKYYRYAYQDYSAYAEGDES